MISEGFGYLLQSIISGLSVGSVYAIVALGFVLIYKATDVINFAQGELMMAGAYICFFLITTYEIPYAAAFLLTLAFSAMLGMLIEIVVLRRMVGEPIFSVIIVIVGLASVMKGMIVFIWGPQIQRFPSPLSGKFLSIGGFSVFQAHLFTLATVLCLVIMFYFFFKHSMTGIAMRATSQDQDTALLMGVSVKRVFSLSWAIAAVVASVGGVFFAGLKGLDPTMSAFGLRAFPAAILGGMDSIIGAICGGIIIGLIESLSGAYLGDFIVSGFKDIVAFLVMILVLVVRPYGLFGTKEIERV